MYVVLVYDEECPEDVAYTYGPFETYEIAQKWSFKRCPWDKTEVQELIPGE